MTAWDCTEKCVINIQHKEYKTEGEKKVESKTKNIRGATRMLFIQCRFFLKHHQRVPSDVTQQRNVQAKSRK